MRLFTSLTVLFIAFLINAMPGYGQEDLKISVTASRDNVKPGDEIIYMIKYSNAGNMQASNVKITSQLPDLGTYTYVSSHPQGVVSGNVITWDVTQVSTLALLGGHEQEITITIKAGIQGDGNTFSSAGFYIPSAFALLNCYATIQSERNVSPLKSNSVSISVEQEINARVSNASGCIKSSTPSSVYYLMQLRNTGNVYDRYELTSTNYDCDGPGGKDFDPLEVTFLDGNDIPFTMTDWIAPGQTYFFYLKVKAGPGTNPHNLSCHDINAISQIKKEVVATGNIQTSIEGSPNIDYPDLSVVKTAVCSTTPATRGGSITYTLNYQNSGAQNAIGVQISDNFDDLHVNITDAGSGSVSGNEIVWNIGVLAPGESGSLSYTVLIDPTAPFNDGTTIIPNTAVISSIGMESNYRNNTTTCNVEVSGFADLSIQVTSEKTNLTVDEAITFTIRISNIGNAAAANVVVKNKIPAGMPIGTISDGGSIVGDEINWPTIPFLQAGGFVTYTVEVIPSCSELPGFSTSASVLSSMNDIDETNNSSTLMFTVLDETKPTLKMPADVTVSCDAIPQPEIPSASDNCDASPAVHFLGETSTKGTNPQLADFYNYRITRTWEAIDASGNHSDPASQIITVQDLIAPVTPMLADFTSECSASPEAPTTTDNCAGAITGTTTTTFPITAYGTTIVVWTFDDGHGNTTTAQQKVVVEDTTSPKTPVLPDIISSDCSVVPSTPTTTDNCSGTITGTTSTPFPITQSPSVITWTFDDGHGNNTTANQNVILRDDTPPLIPALLDIIVGECSGTPMAPTTIDNCSGIITGTTSTTFPITKQGVTVVEWTFDDGNGNIITASQNIIVDDVTPPVTPVLTDIHIGECGGTPIAPTTTDNCAGTITGTTSTSFPITKQGTTVVEWIFDDCNGNRTKANQNVIVYDHTPPVAPVLADVTVGECSGTPIAPTTTDNCSGQITGTTSTSFPITKQGTTIVEWTFDDGHGNITKASQNIIVDDVTAPATPVLADVTVGECSGTPIAPTTTDNCSGQITGTTSTSFPITKQGTTIVEWTFDDGHGNITKASQNIIVDDVTAPATPVLAYVTVGECSGTPVAPTTTDNCSGQIIGTTSTPFPITKQGTTIVEWTFDDGHGNITKASQNIIVDDVTAPATPVLAYVTVGECSGTPVAPTTTDNCSGQIIGTTSTPFPITKQGTTIVEWTFDDGNGNTTKARQNVIVKDHTPPVAPVLADVTVGECSGTPIAPTTTDNCTGKITGTTSTTFPITKQGTTVVEWTFDDGNGNITKASQNIIVDDVTPPITPILADVTVGECSGTPIAPTTTDNCAGTITGTTSTTFPITKQGTTVVEWTFDDGNGNITKASQNIIVDDVTPPITPILADVTVGECSGTPIAPTTTDNCSGTITGTTSTTFPITKQGTTVIEWAFDDGNGNITKAIQNVRIKDKTPPQITGIIASTTIEGCSSEDATPAVMTVAKLEALGLSITDACAPDNELTVTYNDVFTGLAPVIVTRTYTISDPSGNGSTCIQTITVVDTQKPEISCVTPLESYQADKDKCSYTVNGTELDPVTTSDNCSVKSVINDFTHTSTLKDAVFPIGKTLVTWTVEDISGNVSSGSYQVIVVDTQSPTIVCATPAINYPSDPQVCTFTVHGTDLDPVATTDNCSVKSVINDFTHTSTLKDAVFPIGTTIVTWNAEDINGNRTSCSYQITVVDKQAPVISCVTPAASYSNNTFGTELDPVASDNCTIASIANDFNNSTSLANAVFPVGSTVVTWRATDESGNSTSCSYTIVILDTQAPVINCAEVPKDGYNTDAESNVYKVPGTALDPVAEDNYSEVRLINNYNSTGSLAGALFPVGQTTVIWTVTDNSGNSANCTQIIKVRDIQQPTITCPADITVVADPGKCSALVPELGVPLTADNCTVASVDNNAPAIFPSGSTTITWTATDASGNTATCTQVVNVTGTPQAVDDIFSVKEDKKLSGNILANDEGCKMTVLVQSHSEPAHGSLTIAGNGNFTYIPDDNYYGEDLFTYRACNENGNCSEAKVSISVESVDDLPQASNDTQNIELDLVLEGDVAANDLLSGDDGNVWSLVDAPSHGTIDFNQDGTYSYTAATDFLGSDSFTYQLCDQDGDCSQAKVSITIEDVISPNQIMTPNGDYVNDTFIIDGINRYPVNKVTIYNRWGNVVYKKNNYQNEWDGVSNENVIGSQSLPVGTYYYLIDYGKNRHKTGFVYLDR